MLSVSYGVGVGAAFLLALCTLVTLAASVGAADGAFFAYTLGAYHALSAAFFVRSLRFYAVDQPAASGDERADTLRQSHVITGTCLFQWCYFMVIWLLSIDRGFVFTATIAPWIAATVFFTEAERRLRVRFNELEQQVSAAVEAATTPDKV
jgi:hypothetical protein